MKIKGVQLPKSTPQTGSVRYVPSLFLFFQKQRLLCYAMFYTKNCLHSGESVRDRSVRDRVFSIAGEGEGSGRVIATAEGGNGEQAIVV